MDLLKKFSASSTRLSVESPLSTVVQSPLNSGSDPFANRTFDGVSFIKAFLEGETGAEQRLDGAGGEDNGYILL